MKGFGTDEKAIINILANRSLKQRRELNRAYNHMYGKKGDTLDKMLISETSGHFRTALLTLWGWVGGIYSQVTSRKTDFEKKKMNTYLLPQ